MTTDRTDSVAATPRPWRRFHLSTVGVIVLAVAVLVLLNLSAFARVNPRTYFTTHWQHGRHMPLFTDSMLLGEVVRRAAEKMADRVLFAPLTWLGNSEHHLNFAGTLSAAPRTYLNLLGELLENFIHHGFRRLLLINGHGGNIVPSQQAVYEVRQRHRARADLLLLAATYWGLGGKPHEVDRSIEQQRMAHACEWETSMVLRLAPHLVGDLGKVEPVELGVGFEPAVRGWVTQDRTADGHIGNPALPRPGRARRSSASSPPTW